MKKFAIGYASLFWGSNEVLIVEAEDSKAAVFKALKDKGWNVEEFLSTTALLDSISDVLLSEPVEIQ
jgi:hypothetical protein